jgi:hypothetical protein
MVGNFSARRLRKLVGTSEGCMYGRLLYLPLVVLLGGLTGTAAERAITQAWDAVGVL